MVCENFVVVQGKVVRIVVLVLFYLQIGSIILRNPLLVAGRCYKQKFVHKGNLCTLFAPNAAPVPSHQTSWMQSRFIWQLRLYPNRTSDEVSKDNKVAYFNIQRRILVWSYAITVPTATVLFGHTIYTLTTQTGLTYETLAVELSISVLCVFSLCVFAMFTV